MKSPKSPQGQSSSKKQNAKSVSKKPGMQSDPLQSEMEKFPKPNTFPRNWDLSSFLKR